MTVPGWPAEQLLAFAAQHQLEVDLYARQAPVILHAPVGTCGKRVGITDEEILAAIRKHTLGEPG